MASYSLDVGAIVGATATASVAWFTSVSLLAGVSIGTDFSYIATKGQTL